MLSLADTFDALDPRGDIAGHHVITVLSLASNLGNLRAHFLLDRAEARVDGRHG